MKKQYVLAMVATMGLVGCGGGGGSDDPGASTGTVTAAELQGTWMLTTETYQGSDWVSTRRQTFTVTRSSDSVVRFKDCFETTTNNWNLSDDTLSRSGQPTFTVVDESTLTATSGATQIRLDKLNGSTSPVVADVDATVDVNGTLVDNSQWNQACVATVVDMDATNSIEVKVVGSESGVTGMVTLKFEATDYFAAGQYDYPEVGNDVTGSFSVSSLIFNTDGDLSNPSGAMVLVEGASIDMYVDIVLDSTSSEAPDVGVDGVISFDREWLALPDAQ